MGKKKNRIESKFFGFWLVIAAVVAFGLSSISIAEASTEAFIYAGILLAVGLFLLFRH